MMARPVRVVRVIARLNIGGPARHVTLLDAGLRAAGFDTLLAHGDVGATEGSFEQLVRDSRLPARRIPGLGRRIDLLGDLRAFTALVRLIFRVRPDVVHTHTAKAGVLGRLAAAAFNVTRRAPRRCLVVHTFHGNVFSGYFSGTASRLVRSAERIMALVTDRIIVISDQQRHDVAERYRIAAREKVVVVPLGLDLDGLLSLDGAAPSLRRELGFGDADVVFGYVGRFVPIKDLPTLIRAFALALPKAPEIRLLLAGDGEVRTDLERLASQLRVSGAVRFIGWRHDLAALYQTTDVGVLSSRNEGTPVALIEAMAAARPVLSTGVGGVVDVVKQGLTGLLVPPGDPMALADGMVELARSPDHRSRMGAAARQAVAARFGRARLVTEIIALYSAGLSQKRMSPRRAVAGESPRHVE